MTKQALWGPTLQHSSLQLWIQLWCLFADLLPIWHAASWRLLPQWWHDGAFTALVPSFPLGAWLAAAGPDCSWYHALCYLKCAYACHATDHNYRAERGGCCNTKAFKSCLKFLLQVFNKIKAHLREERVDIHLQQRAGICDFRSVLCPQEPLRSLAGLTTVLFHRQLSLHCRQQRV